MSNLSYDIIIGIYLLECTNTAICLVVFSLDITYGNNLHPILAFLVNSVAYMTLFSLKQVLAEIKHGSPACFGLLYPHSQLDTKGVLAALGGGDNTKVPGIGPLY